MFTPCHLSEFWFSPHVKKQSLETSVCALKLT